MTTTLKKVVAASMVGSVAEWYEFFLYGTASALVFGELFFQQTSNAIDGILAAFALYAVGFLARPLGGLVFGHYGDKIGRKKLLQISLIIVGITTFLMGCIPTFHQIGYWAPTLLVILRLIQGFAFGGEWGGAVILVSEHSPDDRRLLGKLATNWRTARKFSSHTSFIITFKKPLTRTIPRLGMALCILVLSSRGTDWIMDSKKCRRCRSI